MDHRLRRCLRDQQSGAPSSSGPSLKGDAASLLLRHHGGGEESLNVGGLLQRGQLAQGLAIQGGKEAPGGLYMGLGPGFAFPWPRLESRSEITPRAIPEA